MAGTVLVIGAEGFIGARLSHFLHGAGYSVVGVDRGHDGVGSELGSFNLVKMDLPSEDLSAVIKSAAPDWVVHAAGSASVADSVREPGDDFRNSVVVTESILEAIRKSERRPWFTLLSSAAVYGDPLTLPVDEQGSCAPISPYGYHKLLCEALVRQYAELYGLPFTIARIFSAYGPGLQRQVLFDLCRKMIISPAGILDVHGTGEESRDFIHIDDLTEALEALFRTRTAGVVNVGSGRETRIKEVVATLASAVGFKGTISYSGSVRPGDPGRWCADTALLGRTGFVPQRDIVVGLREYAAWYTEWAGADGLFAHESPRYSMPNDSSAPMSIALCAQGDWLGGVAYLELLAKAIRALPTSEQPRLVLVFEEGKHLPLYEHMVRYFDDVVVVGDASVAESPVMIRQVPTIDTVLDEFDFFYPVNSSVGRRPHAASWIPDFQHIHLPRFFSEDQRRHRDHEYKRIAESGNAVVFSSQDAANDFARLFPQSRATAHVLSFYALPEESWYSCSPREVVHRHSLPSRYLICCNQFWAHKNHRCLFEALRILRDRGIELDLVCTGATIDNRASSYFTDLMSSLDALGMADRVHIVGALPRMDQLQLVRQAIAVVQPSLFEGWSTVVEDARVLGKTVFLSDLPVHIEQNPRGAIFFERTSPLDLAEKISGSLAGLAIGPEREREHVAATEARVRVQSFGRTFMAIAAQHRRERVQTSSSRATSIADLSPCELSIVVATKNRAPQLEAMLRSLRKSAAGIRYEVVVVAGDSTDDTDRVLGDFPECNVLREELVLGPGRHSWSQLYNLGFQRASGTWGMYASDDIVFEGDAMRNAIDTLRRAPAYVGGGAFFYRNLVADEKKWEAFGIDFTLGHRLLINYGLLRLDILKQVGGLSEEYRFYAADGDVCFRYYEQGYDLMPLPGCCVTHDNRLDCVKTVNLEHAKRDQDLYVSRWAKFVDGSLDIEPRRLLWDPSLERWLLGPYSLGRCHPALATYWHSLARFQVGDDERGAALLGAALERGSIEVARVAERLVTGRESEVVTS